MSLAGMKTVIGTIAIGLLGVGIALADAPILKGRDDRGQSCSLEVLTPGSPNSLIGAQVRTNYGTGIIFQLAPVSVPGGTVDSDRVYGFRRMVTGSTQMEFSVVYSYDQKAFSFSETRLNRRSGEIFFESYRECRID